MRDKDPDPGGIAGVCFLLAALLAVAAVLQAWWAS